MLITCYRVTLLPGGPEEGGWWYDHHELDPERPSIVVGEGIDPYPTCRALNASEREMETANGEYEYHSVLSAGGHARWRVEDERGEDVTTERPHYE